MSKSNQITAKYREYIARDVVEKFGASYQNYETIGKVWRQKFPYSAEIEKFIVTDTRVFLRLLDVCDKGNMNMMYKVCYNISEHLSKYFVKKVSGETRENVTQQLLHDFFFDFSLFVEKFKKSYKRPLNTENEQYVKSNPGVVAMYNALQEKQKQCFAHQGFANGR